MKQGFWKVSAAAPDIRVADCAGNAERILETIYTAAAAGVRLLVLPELCLTGSTAGDLFYGATLLRGAEEALSTLLEAGRGVEMLVLAGLPAAVSGRLYNCAALLYRGELLGVVPESACPRGGVFSPGPAENREIFLCGQTVPFGGRLLFRCRELPDFTLGVEVGGDISAPVPPSGRHAAAGATVLAGLSAERELTDSAAYRRMQVICQSGRLDAGYICAGAGQGESTTDGVFSGHEIIAEGGVLLAEAQPFSREPAVTDLDVEKLVCLRRRDTAGGEGEAGYRVVPFSVAATETRLTRYFSRTPFVPEAPAAAKETCRMALRIQAEGLARRMEHTRSSRAVVAVSGGLDSTLALLAVAEALKLLGRPAEQAAALSMPCFGTTRRTRDNGAALAAALGAEYHCIPIDDSVLRHFRDIGLPPEQRNTAYENAQARERTQVAMDWANLHGGLVVGTGDLSELALGWATYNGDHMSMYGVNASLPKTLIREMVGVIARAEVNRNPSLSAVLEDILATPVSPELLPPKDGEIVQRTEELVGPYVLHDFFLYHMLCGGCGPVKLYRLARYAFRGGYDDETLLRWLRFFLQRFFSQQFKRSCLPDGPQAGPVSLSPRGGWSMPSDAAAALWQAELDTIIPNS